MAKQTKNLVRLGIFVTVSVLLFVIGIFYLGNSKNLFGKTFTIFSDFRNVNGLHIGGSVRFSGISVGSVQDILILNDSTLRINMMIQKRMQPYIKKDAVASVGTDGLVGSTLININPGKGNLQPVEDEDIIPSYSRVETEEVFQTLGATSENIALLTMNLLEVSEKLNSKNGILGSMLNDPQLANNIKESVFHIKNSSKNLANLSGDLQLTMEEVRSGKGLLGTLITDSTLMPQITSTIGDVDTMIHHVDAQIKPLFSKLNRSIQEFNDLTSEINDMVQDVNQGQGVVGTLLKDDATDQQVQQILSNVNETTVKLNENLEALRSNWFFRKYYKKKRKAEKKKQAAQQEKDLERLSNLE